MKILFIDTSGKDVSIATYKDNKILSLISQEQFNKHSIYTIPYIKKSLDDSHIKEQEIEKIIVVSGPGSFTGIRIGLTIAKVYSYLLNINVVTISSLKALALSKQNCEVIAIIDARNDNYYVGAYNSRYENLIEEKFMNKQELLSLIKKYPKAILVSNDNFNIDSFEAKKISLDIENIINYYKNDPGVNNFLIKTNYLKKPQAEENKNQ